MHTLSLFVLPHRCVSNQAEIHCGQHTCCIYNIYNHGYCNPLALAPCGPEPMNPPSAITMQISIIIEITPTMSKRWADKHNDKQVSKRFDKIPPRILTPARLQERLEKNLNKKSGSNYFFRKHDIFLMLVSTVLGLACIITYSNHRPTLAHVPRRKSYHPRSYDSAETTLEQTPLVESWGNEMGTLSVKNVQSTRKVLMEFI